MMLYEMSVGNSPFYGDSEDDLFHSILHYTPQYPRSLPPEVTSLLNLVSSTEVCYILK